MLGTQSGSSATFNQNDPFTFGVSNLSNVPFGNIEYSKINSIGKTWVRKMALAFAKETLGQIRSKVASIPIPNGDLVLNGPALIQEGMMEQENLRQELKEYMDGMTYARLMQTQLEESEALQRILSKIPMRNFCRVIILNIFLD